MTFMRKLLDKLRMQNTVEEIPDFPIEDNYLIKSQYSDMPRYYTIDGVKYDIDDPKDIVNIPVFKTTFILDGQVYGMDSVLRKHSSQLYLKNKAVYNACQEKLQEYEGAGIHFQTKEESDRKRQYQQAQEQRANDELKKKQLHDSFKISDMHQFPAIPFEFQWVTHLNHTNGIAWFMLNKNNQYIALEYINEIDKIIIESRSYIKGIEQFEIFAEEIDFNYPIPMYKDSLPNTYVECIPYTKTGKISKYPIVLYFRSSELVVLDDGYKYQAHPYIGEIRIMVDGNIGMANVLFAINHTRFSIRLEGLNLTVKRIDSDNGTIYKS